MVIGDIRYKVLGRHSDLDSRTVDASVNNKWKWEWLTEKDKTGINFLSDYVVKIDKPGAAFCTWCRMVLLYGSSGKNDLKKHSLFPLHKKRREEISKNTMIPSSYMNENQTASCSVPYGVAENVHNAEICSSGIREPPKSFVSFVDRQSHMEAFICSFICENNLSLSLSPKLIDFAKTLASDSQALNEVHMERPCAKYKIVDGLSLAYRNETVRNMRQHPFSINLDECTAKSYQKFLAF